MKRFMRVLFGAFVAFSSTACLRDRPAPSVFELGSDLSLVAPREVELVLKEGFSRAFAGVIADSVVWVVNGDPPMLVSFSAAGGVERSRFGRDGAGPGELRTVTSVEFLAPDTLIVIDASLSRLSIFLTNGEFVRSTPIQLPLYASLSSCRLVRVSLRCVVRQRPDPRSIAEGESGWDSAYVASVSLSGDSIFTVSRLTAALPGTPIRRVAAVGAVRLVTDEEAADVFLDVRDPIQAVASSGTARLVWEGDKWNVAQLAEGVPVANPFVETGGSIPARRIAAGIWGDDSSLWVSAFSDHLGTREWMKLDREGKMIIRAQLPSKFYPWRSSGQRLLGRSVDSSGVEQVLLIELKAGGE